MTQKSSSNNSKLAKRIQHRRRELNLTVEEAAARAGIGTETWRCYEAGETIRQDKCKGICKALGWNGFPSEEECTFVLECEDAWSEFLAENYGPGAALAFDVGSEILLGEIESTLPELSAMPAGSHIGQVNTSLLKKLLPPQFLTKYNYEFFYHMKCTLLQLRQKARNGKSMTAHSVFEELILYLCDQKAKAFLELSVGTDELLEEGAAEGMEDWVFELFADRDIVTFLYSDCYLQEEDAYHFAHWNDRQFFITEKE